MSKPRNWLGSVGPEAGRRVFARTGVHPRTPARCTAAALAWAQRSDLPNLEGRALEDARADLAVIIASAGPGPIHCDTRPGADAPKLAELAADLVSTVDQLRAPGDGPKESGMVMPNGMRHVFIWDPSNGGPARSHFVSRDFLTIAMWRLRWLFGEHIHRIRHCPQCRTRFLIGKRAQKFCSSRCAQNARMARFVKTLTVDELKRRRRRAYLGRLMRRDPDAAKRYLARLERTDPAAARRLERNIMTKLNRKN